jgi:DNA mismatch endonuclease (patch repair protein)
VDSTADVFSKKKRSEVMSNIRSKDTKPELILRNQLDGRIFRYQPRGIIGRPDFACRKRKLAVFVDGCFWHGCPKCYIEPKSNREFWIPKIKRNVKNDRETNKKLRLMGWTIIRIWEHEIKRDPQKYAENILRASRRKGGF